MNAIIPMSIIMLVSLSSGVVAAPDQYPGDTAIYGGVAQVKPNVLIILDNSLSMKDDTLPGNPFVGTTTYTGNGCGSAPCPSNVVYKCAAWGQECGNWVAFLNEVNSVTMSCPSGTDPKNMLVTTGMWNSGEKKLTNTGGCSNGSGIYATGNWINWRATAGVSRKKIDIAKSVITNLLNSTTGVNFGLMVFNGNQGGRIYSTTVSGSTYVAAIKDMDAIFTGTTTNRTALVSAVNSVDADSWTPLAETLFESMRYYQGAQSEFSTDIYTSPIEASCQKNYVVIVTDGMSTGDSDNFLKGICTLEEGYTIPGDCDHDGFEPSNDPAKNYENSGSDYLDDVAKYMHEHDMKSAYAGSTVTTYAIGFGLGGANPGAIKLLNETAANGAAPNADGTPQKAFLTNDETALASAFTAVLGKILEVNSSFVAPVAPVSPENRTYSGSRIYMGFFKPVTQKQWLGNLKKYGVNTMTNAVLDQSNAPATNSDGSFKASARSYWSAASDGGEVDQGGVGEKLAHRNLAADPRKLFTYKGANVLLSDASNAFATTNISALSLGFTTGDISADNAARDKLVHYLQGFDAYDDNNNGTMTENREWIMGDILHSKPLIVHYRTYGPAEEGNCSLNKSIIFVGANDGMLHAFQDCDGSEAWAFIPQDLLPRLSALRGLAHAYYVDSSPTVYSFDRNKNGIIEPADGDMVVIMFGERRGGGSDPGPTGGYYYALDVSDPANPKYLWRMSNTEPLAGGSPLYPELAETWSEPKIGKVKAGTIDKVVAIIGAGYDNVNEDNRYGATQTFSGSGFINIADAGGLSGAAGTSPGALLPLNPKGRGLYIVEIASLDDSGTPSVGPTSGTKVWGFTTDDNFSIPSEVSALDTDGNGYIDRLYVGDTGGNIWRSDAGSGTWSAKKIFSINPGSGGIHDRGRKIFYKPSVAVDPTGTARIYLGTGDREHPLNQLVVDRIYGLQDKGQALARTEADLTNVTANTLQLGDTTAGQINAILDELKSKYGWYIQLESTGEKSLAPAVLFNEVAYYTTYAPTIAVAVDPCMPGNPGAGSAYAVNYLTGEAAVDYNASNNALYSSLNASNQRATAQNGAVLQKSDRNVQLPPGIPSGLVLVINASGELGGIVGAGGALPPVKVKKGGTIIPIYWRMK